MAMCILKQTNALLFALSNVIKQRAGMLSERGAFCMHASALCIEFFTPYCA